MKIALADIETTELPLADKFHVGVVKRLDLGMTHTYFDCDEMVDQNSDVDKWVFHNGLGFDQPKINEFTKRISIPPEKVIDTMVVSKLINYQKFSTHSLKELGIFLKVHKGDYTGGFDTLTQDMIDYCVQDVEVLEAIWDHYKPYIMDHAWADAMRVEHDMAAIAYDIQQQGFKFNIPDATDMLDEVTEEMQSLERGFSTAFPPVLVHSRNIKMQRKKDGTLYSTVLNAMASAPKVEITDDGEELMIFEWKEFNPGSPTQRIDKLWDAGWKPTHKTKGHKKFLSEQNKRYWRK